MVFVSTTAEQTLPKNPTKVTHRYSNKHSAPTICLNSMLEKAQSIEAMAVAFDMAETEKATCGGGRLGRRMGEEMVVNAPACIEGGEKFKPKECIQVEESQNAMDKDPGKEERELREEMERANALEVRPARELEI